MRAAVFGTGQVGRALAAGLLRHGHEVAVGTRDPQADKLADWPEAIQRLSYAEAARFCDIGLLATGWDGTESAVRLIGDENLAGKVLIDVTNPLDFGGGGPGLAVSGSDSGGETVQRWLPSARVVKTFNIVNCRQMIDPDIPGGPGDMFYCGNDDSAKQQVAALLADVGWPSIDCGGIERARLLESLAMLWIVYAAQHNYRDHAFKLLRN